MPTMDWAMLPRHPLAAVRLARRGARALLVAFGLLPVLTACNVELGGPIWVRPTQHPVGHLLAFVAAMVVAVLLVDAIVDLVQWIAKRAKDHAQDVRTRALNGKQIESESRNERQGRTRTAA